jgi:hypothetical protein
MAGGRGRLRALERSAGAHGGGCAWRQLTGDARFMTGTGGEKLTRWAGPEKRDGRAFRCRSRRWKTRCWPGK